MKPSLRLSIVTIFVTFFVGTVGSLSWYAQTRNQETVLELSDTFIEQVREATLDKTRHFLTPLRTAAVLTAGLVDEHTLDSRRDVVFDYMTQTLQAHQQFYSVYVGFEDGSFIQAIRIRDKSQPVTPSGAHAPPSASYVLRFLNRRATTPTESWTFYDVENRAIETELSAEVVYDPTTRGWYKAAKAAKGFSWSDLYVFFSLKKPGITAAQPVFDSGDELIAVVGVDVELDELSHFLNTLPLSERSIPFIANAQHQLVAFPDSTRVVDLTETKPRAVHIEELEEDWVVEASRRHFDNGQNEFTFEWGDEEYLASFSALPAEVGQEWTVGVVVPLDDYLGSVKRTTNNIMIFALFMAIISVAVAWLVGAKISKPVRELVDEANRIRRLDLSDDIRTDSNIAEVHQLADAMRAMKKALDAFGKFVPKGLVKQLMESDHGVELGGERRKLVVLFTDIAGFTGISERLSPEELTHHISEYFEELTHIIRAHNGVIDKYIGDAIMAFWGAPNHNPRQHVDACAALLSIQTKLAVLNADWERMGKPVLKTRVGMHVGEVIVGNVGSSERMNYTILGDTVNVASRLEGLNRLYTSTELLISEAIHDEVKADFLTRPLDFVAVKGRKVPIGVYELMASLDPQSPHHATSEQRLLAQLTTDAFAAYLSQRWDNVIQGCDEILERRPQDGPARILRERSLQFIDHPPPHDWTGHFEATEK